MRLKIYFLLLTLLFNACQEQDLPKHQVQYLALAHTRVCDGMPPDVLSPKIEKIDFPRFDMLLLGGDLACQSSKNLETLHYLNKVFDLSNPNTLWAPGNHDYDRPELLSQFTKRPTFFSIYKDGTTFLVLDSQLDSSNIRSEQLALFNRATDTLSKTKHLVLLHHKLIWLYHHPLLESLADSIANAAICDRPYCINPNNFYEDIYPKLVKIKRAGIDVVLVAGDIGMKVKAFEYQTKEGIFFLATGLNGEDPDDKALVFRNDLKTGKLSWIFLPVSELPQR